LINSARNVLNYINFFWKNVMSIGHIVGTLSEPLTKGLCLMVNSNNKVFCSALSVGVHEFMIEPVVDSIIYAGLSSFHGDWKSTKEYFYNLDMYEFSSKALGSILASQAAEQLYGESLLASSISGIAGSIAGGVLYESIYPSNHTHEEL